MFRIQPWMILLVVAGVQSGPAADRYVRPDPTASAHPYETWDSAATNIHDAIAAAGEGETVWVTNGSYAVTNEIVLGSGIIVESINGPALTTLRRVSASQFRLFTITNANARLDGFTISNGYGRAQTAAGPGHGGGIRLYAGTVQNCRIERNTVRGDLPGGSSGSYAYGGGIRMYGGTVENCRIGYNTAQGSGSGQGHGGGIYASAGTIVNVVITNNNRALGSGNGNAYGGGIVLTGTAQLRDSAVHGNTVQQAGNQIQSYGGGLYMNSANAVASNCLVQANTTTSGARYGGGMHITAGLVTHSRIIGNFADAGRGGGVYMTGGTLRNCLVAGNRAFSSNPGPLGAGLYIEGAGARVEHCTVSRNQMRQLGLGDGIYLVSGQVSNTISYFNFDENSDTRKLDHQNLYQTGGAVRFSCLTNTVGLTGTNNVSGDPGFMDRLTHDYRILPGSPCIDTAGSLAAVTDDLDGTIRPLDGDGDAVAVADMGAYEAPPGTIGPLRINFTAIPEEFTGTQTVTFTAHAAGADLSSLTYAWDLDGDDVDEISGPDKQMVTRAYTMPGHYTVRVQVQNGGAETARVTRIAAIRVLPTITYVSPSGSHAYPHHSWATAATNVQNALDAAPDGSTVRITNGVYGITTHLMLTKGLTVTGVNGPTNTAIQRQSGSTRLFYMNHPNAVIEGLTLRNGSRDSGSGTLDFTGGAVYMTAGTVDRCIISNNTAYGTGNAPGQAGGVYLAGGLLRNSLIFRNTCRSNRDTAHGGGILMAGGQVENCTVVSNQVLGFTESAATVDTSRGGGIRRTGGSVTNTIIVFNRTRNPDATTGIQVSGTNGFWYSCSPDLAAGVNGNLADADPLFVDWRAANFRLLADSPCVDTAYYRPWMETALDLDNTSRRKGNRVDRGAYETIIIPSGTLLIVR